MARLTPSVALLLLTAACSRPPDAPAELEQLCGYLYDHMADEDTIAMEAGIDNVVAWLDGNFDALSEGYAIATLGQGAIDALEPARTRDAQVLVGASVATVSDHSLDDIVRSLILEEQTEVYPDDYDVWEPTFRVDPECFASGDCDELWSDNHSVIRLPLGIRMTTDNTAHYRWTQPEAGRALVTRSWLWAPGEPNVNILQLDDQFYLSVTLNTDLGLVRLKALWADAAIVGAELPEGTALNMLVNGLVAQDEAMYAWLDDNAR
ncbi:MAG: hypothetical protein KTR31_37080 [Myxococcales bacterium]|nr:hypothetical protein [Myxococcales bacterium]